MHDIFQNIKSGEVAHTVPHDGLVARTYVTDKYVVQEPNKGYGDQLLKGATICDYLSQNGVAVPNVVAINDDPVYVVFEKIPGEPLSNTEAFTEEEYSNAVRNAGQELARMHTVEAFGYGKPDPDRAYQAGSHVSWRRFTDQWVQDALTFIASDLFHPIAQQAAEHITLAELPETPPKRFLHLDYTPDNIVIDDDVKAHIIDLDDAYYGDAGFDIMYADLIVESDMAEAYDAFWEGYESVRNPGLTRALRRNYRAMAILQSTKAGEWCLQNEKDLDFDGWRDGLQHRLDNEF